MFKLFNEDNCKAMIYLRSKEYKFDLIYSDMIYESEDFLWVSLSKDLLKPDGVFIVQLDWHNLAEMKTYCDRLYGKQNFINHCIYINDWGGTPKKGFPNKHDDILIYGNSKNWKWYKERIEIPKVTAGTKFDKKGTGMKTPCDVFYDHASFSTVSNERVKDEHFKNLKWQKPEWLMDRLLSPFTDEGDNILDNFMGSGTTGKWCLKNKRNFVGLRMILRYLKLLKQN